MDRPSGSARQAAHFTAQGVMAGAYDVAAAGVESMSRAPMWSDFADRSQPYGTRFRDRYALGPDGFIDRGISGEIVADRREITREELDSLALERHGRAAGTARVNVNDGAGALGRPLGRTGARLMTTLLNERERRDSRYGLQAMCEGGGTANATMLELCA